MRGSYIEEGGDENDGIHFLGWRGCRTTMGSISVFLEKAKEILMILAENFDFISTCEAYIQSYLFTCAIPTYALKTGMQGYGRGNLFCS